MHSVRIELAKRILVGTRITYQATRDVMLYGEHKTGKTSLIRLSGNSSKAYVKKYIF